MVRVRVALPVVIGLLLFGSFLLAPATDPPDDYVVSVEEDQFVSEPTQYGDLSPGFQQVFDDARANDGTTVYTGQTYPDDVEFPASQGLSSVEVAHGNTTYLVQFTHDVDAPDTGGVVRTVGALVGGVALLAYAGYRAVAV